MLGNAIRTITPDPFICSVVRLHLKTLWVCLSMRKMIELQFQWGSVFHIFTGALLLDSISETFWIWYVQILDDGRLCVYKYIFIYYACQNGLRLRVLLCSWTHRHMVSAGRIFHGGLLTFYRGMLRRARLCHSMSSVIRLFVSLWRSGIFFTQVGILRK